MNLPRVSELEKEFRRVSLHAAHPLDLADYAELKERCAAIAKEAREIIRSANETEPAWCRVS